jgi:cytoskeletal protein RodZ
MARNQSVARKVTGSIIILIIAIVLLGVIVFVIGLDKSSNTTPNTNAPKPSNQHTSSDPVKTSNGSNSDTQPSSNGTGPGSNNSLLGP